MFMGKHENLIVRMPKMKYTRRMMTRGMAEMTLEKKAVCEPRSKILSLLRTAFSHVCVGFVLMN